jgi:hypothetical protein
MARHAKLVIAALATTLAATLGSVGVASTADAGSKISNAPQFRDRSWCC